MTIGKLFLLFLIYSFIGWTIEVILKRITEGRFINRGFLIGPYCPIYGCGGIMITLTLTRYYNNPITLFVMAVFICSVLEYFTSYILEKIFNARWWDYSDKKYNINGRICLETLAAFGLLGCVAIYIINPTLFKLFSLLDDNVINVIAIILLLLFIFDAIVSLKIMTNFKKAAIQFKNKDNTEEITRKVKELLMSKSIFNKRLIDAFPDFKTVIVNITKELARTQKELKLTKKELEKANKTIEKMLKKLNIYKKKRP